MAKKNTQPKVDIYQVVTDRIIASLETGLRPWTQPWVGGGGVGFPRRAGGQDYRGVNVFILWSEAIEKGYTSQFWLTFNQAKKLGGSVRKGQKSTLIVYANRFSKEVENEKTGEKEIKSIPFLKAFPVFNADQIEGLPETFYAKPEPVTEAQRLDRIAAAETFFENLGADVRHGGGRAFYSPATDFIQLPEVAKFKDIESYYSTRGHESVHWTGAEKRCNRPLKNKFGDDAYAAEELVAELGAAFICVELGITLEPRDDHAAYIEHWLRVLKSDKKYIVSAASQAQKAVEFLKTLQVKDDETAPAAEVEDEEAGADLTPAELERAA